MGQALIVVVENHGGLVDAGGSGERPPSRSKFDGLTKERCVSWIDLGQEKVIWRDWSPHFVGHRVRTRVSQHVLRIIVVPLCLVATFLKRSDQELWWGQIVWRCRAEDGLVVDLLDVPVGRLEMHPQSPLPAGDDGLALQALYLLS